MNKRETALEVIRIEYAEHGEATDRSTRAYIENRISAKAFNVAVNRGMEYYESNNNI